MDLQTINAWRAEEMRPGSPRDLAEIHASVELALEALHRIRIGELDAQSDEVFRVYVAGQLALGRLETAGADAVLYSDERLAEDDLLDRLDPSHGQDDEGLPPDVSALIGEIETEGLAACLQTCREADPEWAADWGLS